MFQTIFHAIGKKQDGLVVCEGKVTTVQQLLIRNIVSLDKRLLLSSSTTFAVKHSPSEVKVKPLQNLLPYLLRAQFFRSRDQRSEGGEATDERWERASHVRSDDPNV